MRFVDDYAHLPTEVAAVIAAARATGPDRVVVVFQPHRYTPDRRARRPVRRRLLGGRRGGRHRRLRGGRVAAARGDRAGRGRRGASRPSRRSTSPTCRVVPSCARMSAGRAAPGGPVPDPRRRGHHLAARRAPGGDAVVSTGLDVARLDAARHRARPACPARCAAWGRAPPTGWAAGRRARRGERRERPRGRPRALATLDGPVPVLVLGEGSNLLVADAGFPGLVVGLGPGFDWVELGSSSVRAGGGRQAPGGGPQVRRRRASTVWSGPWACPGRWVGPCA